MDTISVNGEAITGTTFTMPSEDVTVTVTFKVEAVKYNITARATTNGSYTVAETAEAGEEVTITITPNSGYKVSSVTVEDSDENTIKVTDYTFTMPEADVTITVTFTKTVTSSGSSSSSSSSSSSTVTILTTTTDDSTTLTEQEQANKDATGYTDVNSTAWYADAVLAVVEKGLFNGVSDDEFAPDETMTRAMLMTVLYRLSGDEVEAEGTEWYDAGKTWSMEAGISDGTNHRF